MNNRNKPRPSKDTPYVFIYTNDDEFPADRLNIEHENRAIPRIFPLQTLSAFFRLIDFEPNRNDGRRAFLAVDSDGRKNDTFNEGMSVDHPKSLIVEDLRDGNFELH